MQRQPEVRLLCFEICTETKDDCYFYLGATTLNFKTIKIKSMLFQHPIYCNQLGQAVSYHGDGGGGP